MKKVRLALNVLLVLALLLCPMIGYGEEVEEAQVEAPADEVAAEEVATFSYSEGIDDNGLWTGIKALDYVELPEYMSMPIPADTHTVQDADVQDRIDSVIDGFTTTEQITDRAVQDGDTVNIDYVGSVDGVEFDGGSTGGNGTEVTIGVTSYIDDFLEQLIGHMPGETFNVEVTFPEAYGVEELNGKDAVFVTTINYIVESVKPELTDAFVAENLSASYGFTTIAEMKDGFHAQIKDEAVRAYISDRLMSDSRVSSVPDQLIEYQENSMLNYFEGYAAMYGMDLEAFIAAYVGVSTVDELKASNYDSNVESAKYSLVLQAVAEASDISVGREDIAAYFMENMGTDDYSTYEAEYGLPYIAQAVLDEKVLNDVTEHAVLE